jgi:CheY-like chemotaxis protein
VTHLTDHILLIEDDFAIRETVAEVLEGEGFQVTRAANGQEGLRRLEESSDASRPGVILLDLMMPVMDGWEFRSAQRRDPRYASIPVVVLSAGAGADGSIGRLAPVAFLAKPFELDRLLELVGRYCARH